MKRIDVQTIENLKNINQEDRNVSLTDLEMVRTTDCFPLGGVVVPKGEGNQYEEIGPNLLPYIDVFDEWNVSYEDIKGPIYKSARSTVHFVLNGLVANHAMGDFSGRKYFVFDSLQNHLDKPILSLRPEDTYIKGSIPLSKDACICMSDSTYATLSEEERKSLHAMHLYLYEDSLLNRYSEEQIVYAVLHDLGKPFLQVGAHGYQNIGGTLEDKMLHLIENTCNQYGLGRDPHFQSESWRADFEIETTRLYQSLEGFLDLVLNTGEVEEERKEVLLDAVHHHHGHLPKYYNQEICAIVASLGREFYEDLLATYNEEVKLKNNHVKEM